MCASSARLPGVWLQATLHGREPATAPFVGRLRLPAPRPALHNVYKGQRVQGTTCTRGSVPLRQGLPSPTGSPPAPPRHRRGPGLGLWRRRLGLPQGGAGAARRARVCGRGLHCGRAAVLPRRRRRAAGGAAGRARAGAAGRDGCGDAGGTPIVTPGRPSPLMGRSEEQARPLCCLRVQPLPACMSYGCGWHPLGSVRQRKDERRQLCQTGPVGSPPDPAVLSCPGAARPAPATACTCVQLSRPFPLTIRVAARADFRASVPAPPLHGPGSSDARCFLDSLLRHVHRLLLRPCLDVASQNASCVPAGGAGAAAAGDRHIHAAHQHPRRPAALRSAQSGCGGPAGAAPRLTADGGRNWAPSCGRVPYRANRVFSLARHRQGQGSSRESGRRRRWRSALQR